LASSIAFIRDGKLRPLAVSSLTDALPGVPAIGDFVPGYDAYVWSGITGPKGTPPEVVATLSTAITEIVAEPKFKEHLADMGNIAVSDTPAEFAELIAEETDKWSKVVKFAGIKPE
jgi:tripartite-type tricarboxylate transporter receptor subunit TctC